MRDTALLLLTGAKTALVSTIDGYSMYLCSTLHYFSTLLRALHSALPKLTTLLYLPITLVVLTNWSLISEGNSVLQRGIGRA